MKNIIGFVRRWMLRRKVKRSGYAFFVENPLEKPATITTSQVKSDYQITIFPYIWIKLVSSCPTEVVIEGTTTLP